MGFYALEFPIKIMSYQILKYKQEYGIKVIQPNYASISKFDAKLLKFYVNLVTFSIKLDNKINNPTQYSPQIPSDSVINQC